MLDPSLNPSEKGKCSTSAASIDVQISRGYDDVSHAGWHRKCPARSLASTTWDFCSTRRRQPVSRPQPTGVWGQAPRQLMRYVTCRACQRWELHSRPQICVPSTTSWTLRGQRYQACSVRLDTITQAPPLHRGGQFPDLVPLAYPFRVHPPSETTGSKRASNE